MTLNELTTKILEVYKTERIIDISDIHINIDDFTTSYRVFIKDDNEVQVYRISEDDKKIPLTFEEIQSKNWLFCYSVVRFIEKDDEPIRMNLEQVMNEIHNLIDDGIDKIRLMIENMNDLYSFSCDSDFNDKSNYMIYKENDNGSKEPLSTSEIESDKWIMAYYETVYVDK